MIGPISPLSEEKRTNESIVPRLIHIIFLCILTCRFPDTPTPPLHILDTCRDPRQNYLGNHHLHHNVTSPEYSDNLFYNGTNQSDMGDPLKCTNAFFFSFFLNYDTGGIENLMCLTKCLFRSYRVYWKLIKCVLLAEAQHRRLHSAFEWVWANLDSSWAQLSNGSVQGCIASTTTSKSVPARSRRRRIIIIRSSRRRWVPLGCLQ